MRSPRRDRWPSCLNKYIDKCNAAPATWKSVSEQRGGTLADTPAIINAFFFFSFSSHFPLPPHSHSSIFCHNLLKKYLSCRAPPGALTHTNSAERKCRKETISNQFYHFIFCSALYFQSYLYAVISRQGFSINLINQAHGQKSKLKSLNYSKAIECLRTKT